MKRESESDTSEDSAFDKRPKIAICSSDQNSLNLERVHLSEDVLELSPECTIEISNEGSDTQLSQDQSSVSLDSEYNLFAETHIEFMNITEPLNNLRKLLERKTRKNLAEFQFVLQDSQELDSSKNLVNQCVQGEGIVQINVDIIEKEGLKKINIVDVLKPAEEVPLQTSMPTEGSNRIFLLGDSTYVESLNKIKNKEIIEDPQQVTRWIMSPDFRRLHEKFRIPNDPTLWTEDNVKLWLEWATSHFKISKMGVRDFKCTGSELMSMSPEQFKAKIGYDANEMFWTHFELLRKFKIVAVVQPLEKETDKNKMRRIPRIGPPKVPYEGSPGNHTGSNGQIQLWQFLLELLTDKDYRDYIQWVDNDGEFKLINPEIVAQLWGQRKNKPTMNYEKLSRALRYYYDGEMLAKVHGKRFVYKFVCDLKSLLGYDAYELNKLVKQCEEKVQSAPHSTVLTYQIDSSSIP